MASTKQNIGRDALNLDQYATPGCQPEPSSPGFSIADHRHLPSRVSTTRVSCDGKQEPMPLCPRCGAGHDREAVICAECGKRLQARPQVVAQQTSLTFPTCIDGPGGCEGPAVGRSDGQFRCTAHDVGDHLTVRRIPSPVPLTCVDGPVACSGLVTLSGDGQLRCSLHRREPDKPGWRSALRRWFG